MSNLPLLVIIGVIAIVGLCFVHGLIGTSVPRHEFVSLGLVSLGLVAFCYIALWVVADQAPVDFSLGPIFTFAVTMWATAVVYSTLSALLRHCRKKDIAPSH